MSHRKISKHNQTFRQEDAYTLFEIMVAVTIFLVLLFLSLGIFRYVMEAQRNALSSQNIQESMRFAFETMSREIRTAQGKHEGSTCDASPADGEATVGYYKVFNTNSSDTPPDSSNVLYFRNLDNECVTYATSTSGQLLMTRYDQESNTGNTFAITPDEIEIDFLSFFVIDDQANAFHSLQPRVTITMEAEIKSAKASGRQRVRMQTTVSSRYYE